MRKICLTVLFLLILGHFLPAFADECNSEPIFPGGYAENTETKTGCPVECSFSNFFKNSYKELAQKLCLDCDREKIFNILFDAYSIKFKTIDYEYIRGQNALGDDDYRECRSEIKKYLKNLNEIAIEEYDSFLDDLSFEICESEHKESRIIKKHKKHYKKSLKKLVSKCR